MQEKTFDMYQRIMNPSSSNDLEVYEVIMFLVNELYDLRTKMDSIVITEEE